MVDYGYFTPPAYNDAWSAKIGAWQRRERADSGLVAPPTVSAEADPLAQAAHRVDPGGSLRGKYFVYRAERKRLMAESLAQWIQAQAREHYFPDGPVDHWATLEETLERDGDDCDGLELLTFHALLDLGFSAHEVYRAIVYRPLDGQHHMVTLWFEDQSDPWVIDPTGAMTLGMPRMSSLPNWIPIKVFSETTEYTVRPDPGSPSFASLAANDS